MWWGDGWLYCPKGSFWRNEMIPQGLPEVFREKSKGVTFLIIVNTWLRMLQAPEFSVCIAKTVLSYLNGLKGCFTCQPSIILEVWRCCDASASTLLFSSPMLLYLWPVGLCPPVYRVPKSRAIRINAATNPPTATCAEPWEATRVG